jgi:hypothetical protein
VVILAKILAVKELARRSLGEGGKQKLAGENFANKSLSPNELIPVSPCNTSQGGYINRYVLLSNISTSL